MFQVSQYYKYVTKRPDKDIKGTGVSKTLRYDDPTANKTDEISDLYCDQCTDRKVRNKIQKIDKHEKLHICSKSPDPINTATFIQLIHNVKI